MIELGTFNVDVRLSTSYGATTQVKEEEGVSELQVEETEDNLPTNDAAYDDPCLKNISMYQRKDQNINIDIPIKEDLYSTNTILGLMKCD